MSRTTPRIINVDLDQVVANFPVRYEELTGHPWEHLPNPLARWEALRGKEKGFFLSLPAYMGAVEFMREVEALAAKYDCVVRILTAIPSLMEFPTAAAEKVQWVKEVLQSDAEVIIAPYAKDKCGHCAEGDILIDDSARNIDQWTGVMGVGILHKDFETSLFELKKALNHKQVIILRKDLNMRKGKMVAQGSHASGAVIFNTGHVRVIDGQEYLCIPLTQPVKPWLRDNFKKICASVNSEEELLAIHETAQAAGVLSVLITDSGLTEFHGVPTNTAIAVGPDEPWKVDRVTSCLPSGRLPLL